MRAINKKILLFSIFSVALVFTILIVGFFWYLAKISKTKTELSPPKSKPTLESHIQQQLEELEKLRKAATLTEKEIKTQIEEMEKLGGKAKGSSQEEIQRQLEELEKLRQQ